MEVQLGAFIMFWTLVERDYNKSVANIQMRILEVMTVLRRKKKQSNEDRVIEKEKRCCVFR